MKLTNKRLNATRAGKLVVTTALSPDRNPAPIVPFASAAIRRVVARTSVFGCVWHLSLAPLSAYALRSGTLECK
jgi:hypothetical protein